MAQAEKAHNIETKQQQQQQEHISTSNNYYSKDMLQSLAYLNDKLNDETQKDEDEKEDFELSLGLSLNGRFGVDPSRGKKLTRSSSIPDFINPTRERASAFVAPVMSSSNLLRACSLPTEECRKRKEMQSLRRMEAKRKRIERQRSLKAVKDRENGISGNHGPLSQGSVDSHGSGSSGISEFESQQAQGMNKHSEARSTASILSLSECEQKKRVIHGLTFTEKSGSPAGGAVEDEGYSKHAVISNGAQEMVRNVLEDMPYVSTKGDGPDGKRIEGFLYRYRKDEEVRIVCVCHGSFFTPAEFVKHAGGGDVTNPLKHIVVNHSLF